MSCCWHVAGPVSRATPLAAPRQTWGSLRAPASQPSTALATAAGEGLLSAGPNSFPGLPAPRDPSQR